MYLTLRVTLRMQTKLRCLRSPAEAPRRGCMQLEVLSQADIAAAGIRTDYGYEVKVSCVRQHSSQHFVSAVDAFAHMARR